MKIRLALSGVAALLAAAATVFFMARTPPVHSPTLPAVEPPAAGGELADADLVSQLEDAGPGLGEGRRSPVADEPLGGGSAALGTKVLRLVLEGIPEQRARETTVTLTGVDERIEWPDAWPAELRDGWSCEGLTSELDLDPFFASVAARRDDLRLDELEVRVDHPLHLRETIRIPVASGVERESGRTVYEARVRLAEVVFWPELTLAVRDGRTRAHLEGVELRCIPTAVMGIGQTPGEGGIVTQLGDGLRSPIALSGGRREDGPTDRVACLALGSAADGAPPIAELFQPEETARGVVVYARAPGYAWGRTVVDVSTGAESELLLAPAAALEVRFENVRREAYAALEKQATLYVVLPDPDGGWDGVWVQGLDETLETDGLRLDALEPGDYAVSVELGAQFSWRKRTVLAREEFALAAGETRELVMALPDPPAPPARATLGGVVSFPELGGEEDVRLLVYASDYEYGPADHELSLADMEPVGGALPSWSFRLEGLAVGLYQVRLWPLAKSWRVELPAAGRGDLELVLPELAEVLVETVDVRTGERIPLDVLRYGDPQIPRRQRSFHEAALEFEGEPGRFRFWAAPGPAYVRTDGVPGELGYGESQSDLQLVPGLQSVRFELAPLYAIRFEFRVGGAALPYDDAVYYEVLSSVRAVDHEGEVTPLSAGYVEASAPGTYEVGFEGVGADRFLPIPPRRVDLRAGETAMEIVELHRK